MSAPSSTRSAIGAGLQSYESWAERKFGLIVALWLAVVAVWLVVISYHKPFSNDEVFVVWSASQGSLGAIWRGLKAGVNQDPPLVHVMVHYLFRAFGVSATVSRIPGIVGFLMTLACSALTLKGRVSPLSAFSALLLPLATACAQYATEARPYGWLLGCTAVALYAWQQIWRSQHHRVWAVVYALSLAAALATQFFAVYLSIPFAFDALLALLQRRNHWNTGLIATVAAGSTLGLWLPIIANLTKYSGHHFSPASFSALRSFYQDSFPDAVLALAIMLVLLSIGSLVDTVVPGGRHQRRSGGIATTDAALVLGTMIIPSFALFIGLTITHTLASRYLLFTLAAWFVGIPLLGEEVGRSRWFGLSLFLSSLAAAGIATVSASHFDFPDRYSVAELKQIESMIPAEGDTVIPRANAYLALQYYAAPNTGPRLLYLYDTRRGLQSMGYDTIDRGYEELSKFRPPYRFARFEDYVRNGATFHVLGIFPDFTERWFSIWFAGRRIERRLLSQAGPFQLWDVVVK